MKAYLLQCSRESVAVIMSWVLTLSVELVKPVQEQVKIHFLHPLLILYKEEITCIYKTYHVNEDYGFVNAKYLPENFFFL